ncbi:MAG TPA: hypothetical protein VND64_06425, partial [Pirellulales bacterium]|nr:hypothetical protein [Pirellulales bacterium]
MAATISGATARHAIREAGPATTAQPSLAESETLSCHESHNEADTAYIHPFHPSISDCLEEQRQSQRQRRQPQPQRPQYPQPP